MSESAWFDPRLTVFVIWGIFVFLFICIPSKRLVQSLLYKCGCNCCGYEEEIVPTNISGNQSGTQYEQLPTARKQEIDSLRASHLTFRLHPFSLTLEKKHMVRRTSDNIEDPQSQTRIIVNDNSTIPPPQDRTPPTFENLNNDDIDIEMGDVRGLDPPEYDDTAPCRSGEEGGSGEENKEEEKEAEGGEKEEGQYTHISIPQPGYNFDCEDVVKLALESNENEKDIATPVDTPPAKKSRFRFFSRVKEKEDSDVQEVELKEEPGTANTPITKVELTEQEKEKRRRSCLGNCAICLGEYEVAERIAWSSNPSCNHCFHEDCLVSWLVALGKTKSRHQRFGREPTEAQLLNYDLECPCCRQEFVCRRYAELPEIIEV